MLTQVLLSALLIAVGIVIYLLLSKKSGSDSTTVEWIKSTQQEIRSLQQTITQLSTQTNRELSKSMQDQTRDIHDRLTQASQVIGELKREAGAFSEVSRSMKELHEFLKAPKLRGNIGERVLADTITQMFPKAHFFLQHRFSTGSIVDAAIQTDAGILPIDSKFPMEHFQAMMGKETADERAIASRAFVRDVQKHINDISSKYILPEEGTMDFALMYVPSESVYYEIASDDDLLTYARDRRVYPVSPTTLYAHLQTILLSYEGKKIESRAKEIFSLIRGIAKEYAKLEESYQLLGKHLTNAQNTFVASSGSLHRLGQGIQTTRVLDEPSKTSS